MLISFIYFVYVLISSKLGYVFAFFWKYNNAIQYFVFKEYRDNWMQTKNKTLSPWLKIICNFPYFYFKKHITKLFLPTSDSYCFIAAEKAANFPQKKNYR